MQKTSGALLALLLGAGFANAADMPDVIVAPGILWSWTGLYLGGHVGGGLGMSQFSDSNGPAIYGGNVRSPAAVGGGQIGFNWQIPHSNFVLGAETDASLVGADGTATCLASSGIFISANCHVRQQASGSLTGRLGLATGAQGRTLIYAKGGLAWLREQVDLTTNRVLAETTTSFDGTRWGWTVGGGVEKALTPAWSLRLEYDYANFGSANIATPASFVLPPFAPRYLPTAGGISSVGQNVQTVKLGLNLKLGEDLNAQWQPPASDYHLRGSADVGYVPETEVEIGGRTWYSSGRFQKDLGRTVNQSQADVLNSRLTYDTTSASGELFARIDTSSNLFLKGFIGGGSHLSGQMHDEDWVVFNNTVPYSNTVANPVKGDLGYATADFGYALFRGPSSKVGGFVGYNYFRENKAAYGCVQIANANSDCIPSVPQSTLGITENDTWQSLRLGLNAEVKLMDRLTLTADAAYLPYVAFSGTDNHLLRNVANSISPETGTGKGVQLEAVLAYSFANSFSIGAGGRYWAMWATDGSTNLFSTPCPCQTLPARTERYGGFVQASYKFDGLK